MSFTEKAQVVAVSVILTFGLVGGLYALLQGIILGGDDDAPIIIAGGSLYLGTRTDHQLKANGNDLQFANLKGAQVNDRVIYALESTDENGVVKPYTPSGATKIVVHYTGNDDITLSYDPMTHYIKIVNSDTQHPISKTHKWLPNLRVRRGGKIQGIDVYPDGTTKNEVDCDNDGECSVTVHTCRDGETC